MRFDLREPSRPGSVGDKLQSGESPWMGESGVGRTQLAGRAIRTTLCMHSEYTI